MTATRKSGPLRFDLILVGYRAHDTNVSIDFCDRSFDSKLVRRRVLVLNHEMPAPAAPDSIPKWELIAGSNSLAEFSGWQEGLAHLGADPAPAAGVIFVNDSVATHRHFSSARRQALVRSIRAAPAAALIGFRDQVPGNMSVAGLPLSSWASTYCFALTTEALRRLGGRLYDPYTVGDAVPGGVDEARFFAGLSPDMDAHLRHWLFDGAWYAGARLTAENTERMTRKARCIIAEKLLSARCVAAEVSGLDPFDRHRALRLLDKLQRRAAKLAAKRLGPVDSPTP